MGRYILTLNKAKCLICGDELTSESVHDFKTCSCGNLSVDGGLEYLKRNFIDIHYILEMSEGYNEGSGDSW